MEHKPDGTIHLGSPHPLAPYPAKMTERLEYWAATAPERTYLAQRDAAGGWRKLSYGETLAQVRRIAAALAQRDLEIGRLQRNGRCAAGAIKGARNTADRQDALHLKSAPTGTSCD